MKRQLLICLMMLCSLVAMAAKMGILLDSKGKATMYSDLTTAVNAAVDGDVIYLPTNSYECPKGLLINRLIQLRGDGSPTIVGDVTISIDGTPTMKEPIMEGISVNGKVTVTQSINNFKLRHCRFTRIQFAAPMPNGLIDRCYANDVFMIPPVSENFQVRNTKIYNLQSTSVDNNSTVFINCNINILSSKTVAGQFVNTIINSCDNYETYRLKNSLLVSCAFHWDWMQIDETTTDLNSPCWHSTELYFLGYDCDTSSSFTVTGDDGTTIGVTGGATPFTLTPTVLPKVTYLSTSTYGGVLNVSVKATSNDKQNN